MPVYVLHLEHDKLYIGHTSKISRRMKDHFVKRKCVRWTSLHAPLRILFILPGTLNTENKLTQVLIQRFQWDNVRGGAWTDPLGKCPNVDNIDYSWKSKVISIIEQRLVFSPDDHMQIKEAEIYLRRNLVCKNRSIYDITPDEEILQFCSNIRLSFECRKRNITEANVDMTNVLDDISLLRQKTRKLVAEATLLLTN